MRRSTLPTRLSVGLTGVAAAAALLTPAAAGAAPSGPIAAAAKPVHAAQAPARSVAPSVPGNQMMIVVSLAPVGMAGPAAPTPIVLTAKPAPKKVAGGPRYANEVQWGMQYAGDGASAGVGLGAVYGGIAGAAIGGTLGGIVAALASVISGGTLTIPMVLVGVGIGAAAGGLAGVVIGGVIGAVSGAVRGYNEGVADAQYYNRMLRANAQGVSATRTITASKPASKAVPVQRLDQSALTPPREIPDVKLPLEAHRFIDEAKLVIARAFGIPTPK